MTLQTNGLLRDAKNLELLRLLRRDPRAAIADLARGIAMSAPAVRERLQRLEDAGIITGTTLGLDPAALGYPMLAFVHVRPAPGQLHKIIDLAKRTPQVIECHRVTGEDCFIALAHVGSVTDLERVIDRIIPYAMTNTAIIQSSPVEPRSPLGALRSR